MVPSSVPSSSMPQRAVSVGAIGSRPWPRHWQYFATLSLSRSRITGSTIAACLRRIQAWLQLRRHRCAWTQATTRSALAASAKRLAASYRQLIRRSSVAGSGPAISRASHRRPGLESQGPAHPLHGRLRDSKSGPSPFPIPDGRRTGKLLLGLKAYGRDGTALNWEGDEESLDIQPDQYNSVRTSGVPVHLDLDLPTAGEIHLVTVI